MKSIVISGSTRFAKEMKEWADYLTSHGVHVYYPIDLTFSHEDVCTWDHAVAGATLRYFYKVKKADVMFVFNLNQYVGVSTTLEIGYAVALGKPIVSLEIDSDNCRNSLYEAQIKSKEELLKYLSW